jgi:hypothetical protein
MVLFRFPLLPALPTAHNTPSFQKGGPPVALVCFWCPTQEIRSPNRALIALIVVCSPCRAPVNWPDTLPPTGPGSLTV